MANEKGWFKDKGARRSEMSSSGVLGLGVSDLSREPATWIQGASGGLAESGPATTIPMQSRDLFGLLILLNGPHRHEVYKIDQRNVSLGRLDADILVDDESVSRKHAVVTVSGNDESDACFKILDRDENGLPTKSGVCINGRFETSANLRDRDRVRLGNSDFLFVQLWPGL